MGADEDARSDAIGRVLRRSLRRGDPHLTILSSETGSGKSHMAAREMAAALRLWSDKHGGDLGGVRFIYVTTKKVDRTEWTRGELAPALAEAGFGPGDVRVVEIPSAADCALRLFGIADDGSWELAARLKVPDYISATRQGVVGWDEWKRLSDAVGAYAAVRNGTSGYARRAASDAARRTVEEAERAFRRRVARTYRAAARQYLAETGLDDFHETVGRRDFDWVRRVWPSAELPQSDVIVVTMSRFLRPVDTILFGSVRLCGDFLDDQVESHVVIDEIDRFYGVILDSLIGESLESEFDVAEVFASTTEAISVSVGPPDAGGGKPFSAELSNLALGDDVAGMSCGAPPVRRVCSVADAIGDPQLRRQAREAHVSFARLLEAARGLGADVSDDLGLERRYKSARTGPGSSFIFVGALRDVVDVNAPLAVVPDDGAGVNWIVERNPDPDGGERSFDLDVRRLRGATRRLQRLLMLASEKAAEVDALLVRDRQRRPGASPSRWDMGIDRVQDVAASLCRQLRLPAAECPAFMRGMAVAHDVSSAKLVAGGTFGYDRDPSVYSRGISVYRLTDRSDNRWISEVSYCDMPTSPEALLVSLSTKASVCGMSATAMADTVANFDWTYIRSVLGDRFDAGLPDEVAMLMEASDSWAEHCRSLYDVVVKVLPAWPPAGATDGRCVLGWMRSVIANGLVPGIGDEQIERLASEAEAAVSVGWAATAEKRYLAARYLSLSAAIAAFDSDAVARSGIAYLPNIVDPDGERFIRSCADALGCSCMISFVSSDTWSRLWPQISAGLSSGKKIMVITSYGTAAEGKNIQYKPAADDAATTVRVSDRSSDKKDFDFSYFSGYTHPLVSRIDGDASRLRGYWEASCLEERGEISWAAYRDRLASISKAAGGRSLDVWSIPSARVEVARAVNQGIGRATRSGVRRAHVTVVVDSEIALHIQPDAFEGQPRPLEYRCLERAVRAVSPGPVRVPDRSDHVCRVCSDSIFRFLSAKREGRLGPSDIASYRDWDRDLLAHPTPSDDDIASMAMGRDRFIRVEPGTEEYWYSTSSDFRRDCSVYRDARDARAARAKGLSPRPVSERAARLPLLMSVPFVKKHFEERGYATSWDVSSAWRMTPVDFLNRYMGRLGEAAVEALFEELSRRFGDGFALETLDSEPRIFETFDFRIAGTRVYVDAKHMKGDVESSGKSGVDRALRKLDLIDGDAVLYVNCCLPSSGGPYIPTVSGEGRVVRIPGFVDPGGGIDAHALSVVVEMVRGYSGGA